MSNPTGFYSAEAHCPGHNWVERDRDETFIYYQCSHCGATNSKSK